MVELCPDIEERNNMSECSHLKLVAGSRINNYLGLVMDEGIQFAYPGIQDRQYAYLEIPVSEFVNASTGEVTKKASRNQHVLVVPACSVDVNGGYRFEVHPNPELWQYGVVQGTYYLEPKEGRKVPGFYMTLRKDLDIADIAYAIRIYMCA